MIIYSLNTICENKPLLSTVALDAIRCGTSEITYYNFKILIII